MSIQDRDWYRRDYEKRRKRIEENEKEELRKKRQIGIDAMWNEVEPSKRQAKNATQYYSEANRNRSHHSPFWMRAVQMLGVLAVLAVVLLVIANTEWGSSFMKEKDIRFPSIHLPSLTKKTEKPTEVARANPTSSTALIPSYLVYDGSTQAELDHFAAEYGMTSVKKETDGSLTLSSEKNLIHANVDALVATLTKQCGQPGYSHFSSVSVNEDYTVFTIVVNDVNMSNEEKQVVSDLFLMAGLQAVQTEQAVRNIRVERVNMLGSLISGENTNTEPKAEQKPAAATTTPTSTVTVEMKTISSSKIVKEPSYEGTCPFSVILPNGDKDYYIYLKYLEPSSKSATDRNRITNESVDDVAVYIKAHDNFSCQVPVGVYKLYYTLGDTWYGTEERFGIGAPTYTSEDLLEFYNNGQSWVGKTIELRPVTNGNLDRTKIPGSEFPAG